MAYSNRKKTLSFLDLVVIAFGLLFLLAIVLLLLRPVIKSSKYRQTLTTISEAEKEVIAFASSHQRLPSEAEFSTITRNIDAWGGTLLYIPDAELTASENLCCAATPGFGVVNKGTRKEGIAFLILSEGKDRQNNTGTARVFTIKESGPGYDDIVTYEDITDLRKKVACGSLVVSPDALPDAVEDAPYFAQLAAKTVCLNVPASAPSEWSIGAGTLPPGLTLNQNGTITGSPDTSTTPKGTLAACQVQNSFTVIARQLVGLPAEKHYTLNVVPQKLRILYAGLPAAVVSSPYSATLSGAGGQNAYTWNTLSGALPPRLSLNSSTGVISGMTAPGSEGIYTLTVEISDGCTKTARKFTMTVDTCAPPTLSPSAPITASVGKPVDHTIKISGGLPPYFHMADSCTNNCTQFNLDLQCTDREVVLSGTPGSAGSCSFSVAVQDSCPTGAQTVRKNYIVNIQSSPLP